MIESELRFYALNDFEMKELLTYDVLPFECYADFFFFYYYYYEHDGFINCHMNPDLTFDPQFVSKITSNYSKKLLEFFQILILQRYRF